jgi:hypothetical protein
VSAELRWLLARDFVPPQHFNRAAGLMLFAEEQEPGSRVELLRRLEPIPKPLSAVALYIRDAGSPGTVWSISPSECTVGDSVESS